MATVNSGGSKTMMLLLGAVGFGIAAAILSVAYLKSREAAIMRSLKGEEQEMVTVVVANQDLTKGQQVQAGLFATRGIPSKFVHANAILPAALESYYGRFLVENIARGRPLLTNFMNETFPVDFSDLISQGRRAITIQVDEVQSIAGLTRPGNKIDIYVNIATKVAGYEPEGTGGLEIPPELQQAALEAANQAGAGATDAVLQAVQGAGGLELGGNKPTDVILPVLQNVRVLATGREAYDEHLDSLSYPQRRSELNYTSMTVDVTPEQAALLATADDKGDLIAILRNRNDQNAADFSGITPFDLTANANEMKQQAAIRKAAEAAGATIDENGNWVAADGTVISKDNLVVSENGTVSTLNGQLVASNGVSVNSNGQYVDAQGNVIPPDQIIVNPDGSITSKDEIMKAAGYTKNENGDYVDANGNIVKAEDVIVAADGSIMSKDAIMAAAGYTKNENGDYVDANGNIVKAEDVKVLPNGSIMAGGKNIGGPKVTVNKEGFLIAEDGTVMTADGKILEGVAVNEFGQVVGPDGKVLTDPNLSVAADGTVRDSSGNIIAGVSGSSLPLMGTDETDQSLRGRALSFISLIVGGASKDGIAKTGILPVQPLGGELPEAVQK